MINNRKVIRTLISYIPVLKFVLKKSFNSNLPGSYYFNVYQKHKNELLRIGASFPGDKIGELGPGEVGFKIISDIKNYSKPANRSKIDESINYLYTDEDLSFRGSHIIAVKI